jgi:hypothetical protein
MNVTVLFVGNPDESDRNAFKNESDVQINH